MKKTILILLLAPFIASCAVNGFPTIGEVASSTCGGSVKGKTDTMLKYGKQKEHEFMEMKWKSFVGSDAEFRIVLKPKKGFESNVVKIIGKSGKLPDGTGTPYAWLNASGSAADFDNSTIVLCVPGNVAIGTEYKFDVEIADIGEMDPRARVTF
jgi:hypothetical protein